MLNRKCTLRLAAAVFFLLAAPAALAQGQPSNLVLLAVNDGQTAMDYNASGSSVGACRNPAPGCVRVSGNGQITFRLVNFRQCASGEQWTLTGVQMGGEGAPGKPATWGGLSSVAASDFQADPSSGWAATSTSAGGGITIRDANTAEYSLWYRVQARCDGREIYFDPRIENDGTGIQ